jgi:hypothetical protein
VPPTPALDGTVPAEPDVPPYRVAREVLDRVVVLDEARPTMTLPHRVRPVIPERLTIRYSRTPSEGIEPAWSAVSVELDGRAALNTGKPSAIDVSDTLYLAGPQAMRHVPAWMWRIVEGVNPSGPEGER